MGARALAGWTLAAAALLPAGIAAGEVQFTAEEIRAIVAHGPWPPPLATDPSNRASGKREAIELGERLFFDQRLSPSGKFSCGTCHVPERNWTKQPHPGGDRRSTAPPRPDDLRLRPRVRLGRGHRQALAAEQHPADADARELGASPATSPTSSAGTRQPPAATRDLPARRRLRRPTTRRC
jgi:cytochrome c peroxidase